VSTEHQTYLICWAIFLTGSCLASGFPRIILAGLAIASITMTFIIKP